jgi:hypothetical protein
MTLAPALIAITGFWRFAPWLARAMLALPTALFLRIGWKYLIDPIGAAAASGISLGSPAAITDIRAFGATFLAVAVLTGRSLIGTRWLLTGLAVVAIVVALVTATRLLGVIVDGAAPETLFKLVPELVLLTVSVAGFFIELARRHRADATPPA